MRQLAMTLIATGLAGLFLGNSVHAQQNATTIQLPTFSSFFVSTTVLVPDSGGAYSAAAKRARSGRSTFGSPLHRQGASGAERQFLGVQVRADIHDFRFYEVDLANSRVGGKDVAMARTTPQGKIAQAMVNSGVGLDPADDPGRLSVAEIRRRRAAQQGAADAEAAGLVDRAREAIGQGKPGVAKIYFQMAARRAKGRQRVEILSALRDLNQPPVRLAQDPAP